VNITRQLIIFWADISVFSFWSLVNRCDFVKVASGLGMQKTLQYFLVTFCHVFPVFSIWVALFGHCCKKSELKKKLWQNFLKTFWQIFDKILTGFWQNSDSSCQNSSRFFWQNADKYLTKYKYLFNEIYLSLLFLNKIIEHPIHSSLQDNIAMFSIQSIMPLPLLGSVATGHQTIQFLLSRNSVKSKLHPKILIP
jgi:hypothetical protein